MAQKGMNGKTLASKTAIQSAIDAQIKKAVGKG